MRPLYILLAVIYLTLPCCNQKNKSYSIKIKHFAGAAGLTRIYEVNEKGIIVKTNCDFENCKETIVYKIDFRKGQADSIFNTVHKLRLDTLKTNYETRMLDGLITFIAINDIGISHKEINLYNYNLKTTDSLFRLIDNQIQISKYRFYNWGKE